MRRAMPSAANAARTRHDAFDSLPRSTAAEHLRALLMHHGMLPRRGPEAVARFER